MTDTGIAARRMEISDVERKSDRLHRATTPERASQTPRRVGLSPPPTSARARRARVVRFRSHSTRPLSFARARSSDHDVAIHRVASKRRRRRRHPRRLGSCPRRARGVPGRERRRLGPPLPQRFPGVPVFVPADNGALPAILAAVSNKIWQFFRLYEKRFCEEILMFSIFRDLQNHLTECSNFGIFFFPISVVSTRYSLVKTSQTSISNGNGYEFYP